MSINYTSPKKQWPPVSFKAPRPESFWGEALQSRYQPFQKFGTGAYVGQRRKDSFYPKESDRSGTQKHSQQIWSFLRISGRKGCCMCLRSSSLVKFGKQLYHA